MGGLFGGGGEGAKSMLLPLPPSPLPTPMITDGLCMAKGPVPHKIYLMEHAKKAD